MYTDVDVIRPAYTSQHTPNILRMVRFVTSALVFLASTTLIAGFPFWARDDDDSPPQVKATANPADVIKQIIEGMKDFGGDGD
ncbi:hypothetical protein NCS52_00948000 [Fusarium sp. LHS14.1]|nr:hypothetical protein NCS52_00948000 [Fusarium sp. LHS14.1]